MRFNRLTLVFCAASLIAVGCGDDDGGGGGADAGDSVDANDIDAAPPTATCGVSLNYSSSAPRAGQLVAFNRPDGSLIGTAITDVDGQAFREDCVADTMLTLYQDGFLRGIDVIGPSESLFTVAGVQPGDTVQVGFAIPSGGPPPPTLVNAAITQDLGGLAPTDFLFLSGPPGYCFSSPVSSVTPPPFLEFTANTACNSDAGDVMLLALARSGGGILGYAFGSVAYTPGAQLALSTGAWTAAAGVDISIILSNFPVTATSWSVELREKRGGVTFQTYPDSDSVTEPMVNVSRSQGLPLAAVDTHEARVALLHGQLGPPGPGIRGPGLPAFSYTTLALGAVPAASHSLDLGALMLPRVAGAFATAPESATRPIIQWFGDGDLSVADGVLLSVTYTSPNGNSFLRQWTVVSPDASGMFQMPVLPDSLLEFAPSEGDQLTVRRALVTDMDWIDYRTLITTELTAIAQGALFFDGYPLSRLLLPPPGVPYSRRASEYTNGIIIVGP
ncbi:MAG: hypothetical protein KJO07_01520 [Deltaproteobacteria bacterium]|nr:hypothetical protein [Deltaproteobacteria bacterium]